MTRSRALRTSVFATALLGSLVGCADESEQLGIVADCGKLVLPPDVELLFYERDVMFGDQIVEAIFDIPRGALDAFKHQSGLTRFDPGVPARWRQESWLASGQTDLLASDAENEHLVEMNRTPTRWVVIHDSADDSTRVFFRAGC
ncbi:hypothetical protein [Nocardia sp. NPDC051832]|uniref:hypothetical protein n=1 Tax=Nocardia sp. NPDC051832 TaxID=3155673 RepID=UPI0034194B8A